jgi:hypothetical protein
MQNFMNVAYEKWAKLINLLRMNARFCLIWLFAL